MNPIARLLKNLFQLTPTSNPEPNMKGTIIAYQQEELQTLTDRLEEYDIVAELVMEDIEALDNLLVETIDENNNLIVQNAILENVLSLTFDGFDKVVAERDALALELKTAEEDYSELFQEHEDLQDEESDSLDTFATLYENYHVLLNDYLQLQAENVALKSNV